MSVSSAWKEVKDTVKERLRYCYPSMSEEVIADIAWHHIKFLRQHKRLPDARISDASLEAEARACARHLFTPYDILLNDLGDSGNTEHRYLVRCLVGEQAEQTLRAWKQSVKELK